MANLSNEEVVRKYVAAHEAHDDDAIGALRAADWSEDWPQSGERVRGHDNDRAIMRAWPGGQPQAEGTSIHGSEDRWVITPGLTFQRVVGEGDIWWVDALASYADGSTWFAVGLFELRDGKVRRETWFFGPPLEAPAWREAFVERIPASERSDER